MIVYCSEIMQSELKLTPVKVDFVDPLFSWHATTIKINYKRTLIMTNDSNQIVVVLYDLKLKDFPYLSELIIRGIRESIEEQMIIPNIVQDYLETYDNVIYAPFQNDSAGIRANNASVEVEFLASYFKKNSIFQTHICKLANESLREARRGEITTPYEMLYRDFSRLYGKNFLLTKVLHLHVELDFNKKDVWCDLIVPANFYFESLHRLIQEIFDWGDESLHDFHIYSRDGEVLQIVCDEDVLCYQVDIPMALEWEVKLGEYIPKYKHLKYIYDFEDNWVHSIKLIKVSDSFNCVYPVCINGKKFEPLDIDEINKKIKYVR